MRHFAVRRGPRITLWSRVRFLKWRHDRSKAKVELWTTRYQTDSYYRAEQNSDANPCRKLRK